MSAKLVYVGLPPVLGRFVTGMYEEVHSPFNIWVTAEVLGRSPTPREMFTHYCVNGGVQRYRARFGLQLRVPLVHEDLQLSRA